MLTRSPQRYRILCERRGQSGMHAIFAADNPTELDNLLSVLKTIYNGVRVFSHMESIGLVGIYDEIMASDEQNETNFIGN